MFHLSKEKAGAKDTESYTIKNITPHNNNQVFSNITIQYCYHEFQVSSSIVFQCLSQGWVWLQRN